MRAYSILEPSGRDSLLQSVPLFLKFRAERHPCYATVRALLNPLRSFRLTGPRCLRMDPWYFKNDEHQTLFVLVPTLEIIFVASLKKDSG